MSDPDHDGAGAAGDETLTLDALLQSVYDSVANQVRAHAESAMSAMLAHYFPLDPQTGQMVARVVRLPLPGPNGTPIQRDIPLFSLMRQQDVALDQLVLRMKVNLREIAGEGGAPDLRVSLDPGGAGMEARAEIEIRFRCVDGSEGLARINDAIVKQIGTEPR